MNLFSHQIPILTFFSFLQAYNLGTGRGVSVLDLIHTFEKTNNVSVPYTFEARRAGDISTMYADP